tara:strand:+ start:10763 stop:11305 length:543 start_codon:yes stop_codon:yes gene_type:complete
MTDSKDISDKDKALFRDAMSGVTPNKPSGRVKREAPMPDNRNERRQNATQHREVIYPTPSPEITVGAEDKLFFCRPGIQARQQKRLKQGQFPIEASLDLHRLTLSEAEASLNKFLGECLAREYRHIHIIHGKGLSTKESTPLLKNFLNNWLREQDQVLAFASCKSKDGGAGAVYILLKRT